MKICILGTGSWATGLAQVLIDNGHETMMYGVDMSEINDINSQHCNSKYFKDVTLPLEMKATNDLTVAMDNCDIILITVPTMFVRDVLENVKPLIKKKVIIVNASKGFDFKTNKRISETIRDVIPSSLRKEVVSLIGPSHAEEVIVRQLTTICAVSLDLDVAKTIQILFSNDYFRVYRNQDEIGAEYGVALKNVIALASGAISGLGYGDNTRAALITRGLAEMVRYGMAKGGKFNTYLGLTGIGDLIVTCSSIHSRNFKAGYEIGKNDGAKEFLQNNKNTVEGIRTCKVIYEDLESYPGLEMPITEAIYRVLYENQKPSQIVRELMIRDLKEEI